MLTEQQLQERLAAAPGERVTEEQIKARIKDVTYTVIDGSTVTICNITLDNGYSVRGESACVDPKNFNLDIGSTYAYRDAFRKLWPLFGFLLAERLFTRKVIDEAFGTGQTA